MGCTDTAPSEKRWPILSDLDLIYAKHNNHIDISPLPHPLILKPPRTVRRCLGVEWTRNMCTPRVDILDQTHRGVEKQYDRLRGKLG